MRSEHKIILQVQNDPDYKFSVPVLGTLHLYQSRENLKNFVANDLAVCCCMLLLLLNDTSFENGCSTAKELIYSVFDEESDACGTRIAHKRNVFSTSGVLADFILVSKL